MSIKSTPDRLSDIFNSNYYVQPGDYLYNTGTQRLNGSLVISGDETTYGNDKSAREPIVLAITDPSALQLNNLTTKSYVDTTVETYVSSYVETYVDSKIGYPQLFTFGKAYSAANINTTSGSLFVNFLNPQIGIQSLYLEIYYNVTRSAAGVMTRSTTFPSIRLHSVYNVFFYRVNGTYSQSAYELISGDSITNVTGTFGYTYQPFGIGTSGGNCILNYAFPPTGGVYTNNPNTNGWISQYNITIRILQSNPLNTGNSANIISSASFGGAYFSV